MKPEALETHFDPEVFPQYHALNRSERLFLRTCCYYPPRPRRVRTMENVSETERYVAIFERAFGSDVWSRVAGKDVLDFGCGEGGFTLALAAKGAAHATGLDILPDFQLAQEVAQRRSHPVTFIGTGSEGLSSATYDVVISHDSFEHFAEPERVLAEMVRLTRPGGYILIKFGPPWRNPWGRHLSGTVRRDRPWVHLVVPERVVMHAHSVYHNEPVLSDRYAQLPGGMNKMTVSRFKRILRQQPGIAIEQFTMVPIHSAKPFARVPVVSEFVASSVRAVCTKTGA